MYEFMFHIDDSLHVHVQFFTTYSFHFHDALMHLSHHALPTCNMQFIPYIM